MKTILPWILAVAFAAGAASLYFSNSAKQTEIAGMREQVQQLDALRTQVDDLQKQATAQADQMVSMRKDNDELLSLRNQVRQLGDEKAKALKQLADAQAAANRSQAEVQQVQARVNESATAIAEQRVTQMRQSQNLANLCINILRQLDGAKQQWALEQHKTADAIPTQQDLIVYLPNRQFPLCPAGGTYVLNAVNKAPTCTMPGHVLQ